MCKAGGDRLGAGNERWFYQVSTEMGAYIFVLIIVCVTMKCILYLQSTVHVVLIKWEKVYFILFKFQFVTVQNRKRSKQGWILFIGIVHSKCAGINKYLNLIPLSKTPFIKQVLCFYCGYQKSILSQTVDTTALLRNIWCCTAEWNKPVAEKTKTWWSAATFSPWGLMADQPVII